MRRDGEARLARDEQQYRARVAALFGDLLPVDAVWSNASLQAFCLACRAFAPAPVIEMGLSPETTCAHCGAAVGAVEARKVG